MATALGVTALAPSCSEQDLVSAVRRGDDRAFEQLYSRYRARIGAYILGMVRDHARAEDVAQEVFISVFKTIDAFREESKFSTWLYRVTVNHCKNRIKYLARRHDRDQDELDEAMEQDAAAAVTAPRPSPRPDRALEGAQTEKMLQDAIGELDEDHRVLVVLRDVEDLSIEEICEITGLPDGTVKSRLHRARLVLRKKLQRHGIGDQHE